MSPAAREQGAQVSLVGLQTGVVPVHWVWFAPVHCTQAPLVASQAGVAGVPAQSASTVQGPQVWAPVLQTGVASGQSALGLHWTHMKAEALHAGVAPVQAVLSVVVHWTHWPTVVLQAGVAGVPAQS